MSDGQRFSNPGNGGNDDVYRWSGDQQRQLPGQNQSGDRYTYDGSNRQHLQNGDQDQHDALSNFRMPERINPSDYPQTFRTTSVQADGTQIINIIHCKNAYFNQSGGDSGGDRDGSSGGADYRRNQNVDGRRSPVDFRDCDPNLSNLRGQDRGNTSYYNGERQPNFRNNNDDFQLRINMERQREFQQNDFQHERIARAQQEAYQRQAEMQQRIDQQRDYQMQRDNDTARNIQMYNENCRQYNGRQPERYQPYYSGNQGGRYGSYGNNGGYNDGYDSGYGGPCFGGNRGNGGISIRIPIGNHAGFRINI